MAMKQCRAEVFALARYIDGTDVKAALRQHSQKGEYGKELNDMPF
jgi:hypothetical protein